MASGIEAAGLVLGIFPVVIQTVDWYRGVVTGRDVKLLVDSLRTYELIFYNAVENLLRSTVPIGELKVLLDDKTGAAWKSKSLNDNVTEHLGQAAECILGKISDIYKTLLRLKRKLPSRNDDTNDMSIIERAKHVAKCFVHGPHYKASLERLKIRINEFRELSNDSLKLASSRRDEPQDLVDLNLVQESARRLYDALRGGWKCECVSLHPANIELSVWSLQPFGPGDKVRLKFSFLFADDAQQAQHAHWIDAEVISSRVRAEELRLGILRSLDGTLAATIPNVVSSQGRSSAVAQVTPAGAPPLVADPVQDNESGTFGDNVDLCSMLKSPAVLPPVRRRVGSISDSSGQSYNLFSRPDPVSSKTSVKLAEIFKQRSSLSTMNRVRLALMLAWGVVQISCTDWLKGEWSRDNILLVMDPTNKPKPYISHRFQSSRQNTQLSTLAPTILNQLAPWIMNPSLVALGVFLVEVCYNKPIEDLATVAEKNEQGKVAAHTPLLTAMRLSKVVQEELGVHYAQAVKACFRQLSEHEVDAEGKPKDSNRYARSVIREIIEPLKDVVDRFGP